MRAHLAADPKVTAGVVIRIDGSHPEGSEERTCRIVQENAAALGRKEATFAEE